MRTFIKNVPMIEPEEEDAFQNEFDTDFNRFESMYAKRDYSFFDADKIESIIDHLLILSQHKKAKWAAEKALEHFPYNTVFALRKAQAMSLLGELEDAIKLLLKLEKMESNNVDLLLTLATSFSQLKDADSAIRYYKKAWQHADDVERTDIIIDLAMEYESMQKYGAAIDVLKKGIQEEPKNESLVYELAYCYDQLGQLDRSIKCFEDYIDENPYSYTAWYNLANTFSRLDKHDKAIWAYEYSLIINDEFTPAYFNLGNTYQSMNEYELAIEAYLKCVEIDGDDGMVYCSLGECYEELDELDEALKFYTKATDLFPQLADAWLGRGIINTIFGKLAQAKKEFQKAIDLEEDNSAFYHAMANALEDSGEIDLALEYYREGLTKKNPEKDLVIDYFKCAIDHDLNNLVKEILTEDYEYLLQNTAKLGIIAAFWSCNRRTDALIMLEDLLVNDAILAKTLFLHFPWLNDATEIRQKIDSLSE